MDLAAWAPVGEGLVVSELAPYLGNGETPDGCEDEMSPRECLERARPTGCAPCSQRRRGLPGGRRSSHGLFRGSWGAWCGVCPHCWMPSWELDWQELLCAPTSGLGAGLLPHTLGSSSSVSRRPVAPPPGHTPCSAAPACTWAPRKAGTHSDTSGQTGRVSVESEHPVPGHQPVGAEASGPLIQGPPSPALEALTKGALSGVLCTLKKERSSSV